MRNPRPPPWTFSALVGAGWARTEVENQDRGRCLGVIAATALVLLSGCGSPGGGPESTPATTSSSAASTSAAESTTGSPAVTSAAESTTGSPAVTSATVVITITNFAYQGPDSVSPGSTLTVKNEDSQAHTVTSDQGGLFDAVVPGGGNVVFTAPTTAGSYTYHCTYHGNMHGTLVVK